MVLQIAILVAALATEPAARDAPATDPAPLNERATDPAAPDDSSADAHESTDADEPLDPHRIEVGVLPAVTFSTDFGLGLGALLNVVGFEPLSDPYRWRLEVLASATLRVSDKGAVDFPYHEDYVTLELPGLWQRRLRLRGSLRFEHDATVAYYGVGNASQRDDVLLGANSRRYNAQRTAPAARASARVRLADTELGFIDLVIAHTTTGSWTQVYPGSKLEEDATTLPAGAAARPRGVADHALLTLAAGVLWDWRDHESVPTRGLRSEINLRGGAMVGNEEGGYGGLTLDQRAFVPLWAPYLVLAARLMADMLWGTPPYYELTGAGGINPIVIGGGARSVRGLPNGRYAGRVKVVGNIEVRGDVFGFSVFEQRFHIGAIAFLDAGRYWADFRPHPRRDGSDVGIKLGTGGGLRVQWGEHFVVRADFGYSPTDDTTGLYIGVHHIL